MFIQINLDTNIERSSALTQKVTALIEGRLAHFNEQVTRVEVHLSDENSDKKIGVDAKRCLLVVDVTGHKPTEVSDAAETVERAVAGAAKKMKHSLERKLGRSSNH